MGKSQRDKGHSWERECARDLQAHNLPRTRRQLEYHPDDANGVDLQNTGPFSVQCKSVAKMPSFKTIFDAMPEDTLRVLALKVTNKGSYAVVSWVDFMDLLEAFILVGDYPEECRADIEPDTDDTHGA